MPHRRYKKTTAELLVELQASHDIVHLGNECARFNHKKNEEFLQFIQRQASSQYENIVHNRLQHFDKHSVIAGPWQTTLALLFQQLTAERESILIPNPHHPGILAAIKSSKRSWIQYKCKQSEDWRISFEHLEAISSFNSKVILLSNPHHPTGKMYSKAELLKVLTFAQTYELTVIELCLYHPGETFISIQDVARECMPESRVVSVYSRQNDYSHRTPTWVNYHGVTPIELPTEPEDSLILAYFSQGVTSEEMQQPYHDKIQFFELYQHVPHVEWVYPDSGTSLLFCMVPGVSVKSAVLDSAAQREMNAAKQEKANADAATLLAKEKRKALEAVEQANAAMREAKRLQAAATAKYDQAEALLAQYGLADVPPQPTPPGKGAEATPAGEFGL